MVCSKYTRLYEISPVPGSLPQSFGEFWKDALSVLMARERARIGLAASEGDLSRRIVAYAYDDQEDAKWKAYVSIGGGMRKNLGSWAASRRRRRPPRR